MTSPVEWLNEREERAWRAFTRLRAQLSAQISRDLARRSGISESEYGVLVHLSESPDQQLRSFELCDALQWERSRLSHQLTRMERRGYVARQECPSDARGSFVVLTDEGRAAIEAAAPGHVADVRQHFIDALTDDQLDALAEIAETVIDRLSADDPASRRQSA
ncbi:MAG: MarR family winged helix-turn-helix transcriptional regulator [Nitriliruptoraceae bacterium]